MTISALGDAALTVLLGDRPEAATARRVRALVAELEAMRLEHVVDVVGAFTSVALFFRRGATPDPRRWAPALRQAVERAAMRGEVAVERRREIPVCYGGVHGPDLDRVAQHTGLTAEAVIEAHQAEDYVVQAIGFSPGFPYLGGLAPRLATPRRATPRTLVPAGSVGIGGAQTGLYPFATPGGWNLIGRTPRRMFDVTRDKPSYLRIGDRVRFRAVSAGEFAEWSERESAAGRGSGGATEPTAAAFGVRIVRAGLCTTVQDLGREGYRGLGVPLGGAADSVALRLANLLVGNPENTAALEFTLQGPTLTFAADTVIALGGGDFGLPRWRPLRVHAGETLHLGAVDRGCRGYLAVAGGFQVPPVLGSAATDLRAGFGGHHGRVLRDGDQLQVRRGQRAFRGGWRMDERLLPRYASPAVLRIVDGSEAAEFSAEWVREEFSVSSRSDRMGVRLAGNPIRRTEARELGSAPVAPGTIQVPPDGQPIVLSCDAQTIGGYPKIGHVITADLPVLAQLKPGDRVSFVPVAPGEALAAWRAREAAIAQLREGLARMHG
jgi:KipI family sensor histidine kinase inhibitor